MVTRGMHYHLDHPYPDTRIIIWITPIRIHVTRFSYLDCLKEGQTTLISIKHPDGFHNTSGWPTYAIRIWLSGSLTEVKQVLHVITTAYHGPRSATYRVKGQDEVTTSHFLRSFHMITYHNLCVRWWWPCHHLMSSWRHKISPHHWKEKQCFWNYIYKAFTNKEEVSFAIPSKRSTDLSLSLTMADKTIGGCVRTSRPEAFCRWNDRVKNLY